jgi:uncharacterized protein YggE
MGITAFGAASVKAVPDFVRVRSKIVGVGQTPAAAFEAARAAVRTVRSALREHGMGDAPVEGSRLDLKTATEYVDGTRKFVGYRCQAAFAVESGALDDVEPLLVDVVAAGAQLAAGTGALAARVTAIWRRVMSAVAAARTQRFSAMIRTMARLNAAALNRAARPRMTLMAPRATAV